jgi:drug/metabolite transporter (DMT)-like permease
MARGLLRDLAEWMVGLIGVGAATLVGLLSLLPLMWLEHHHHEAFWVIVIMSMWLSMMYIGTLVSARGRQTCPHCGRTFFRH